MGRQLIIVRHGEGEHLTEGFFSSRPDHPNYRVAHLTDRGRLQAVSAGEALKAAGIKDANTAVVLVSPLPRTLETAEGLFTGSGIDPGKQVIEPRLLEISLGDLEGTATRAWVESGRSFTDFSDAHTYGGETNDEVRQRVSELLDTIRAQYPRGHVVAVTHALTGYELSGLVSGTKVELEVAAPLFLDWPG